MLSRPTQELIHLHWGGGGGGRWQVLQAELLTRAIENANPTVGRQAGRRAGRQAGGQAGRRAGRQAGRQTGLTCSGGPGAPRTYERVGRW